MAYSTLMAHLDVGASNAGLLRITSDLATRFKARVIGIAACQPMPVAYDDGYMSKEVIEQDRAQCEKEIDNAEAAFRVALQESAVDLGWRSTVSYMALTNYIAEQARAADLLITGPDQKSAGRDSSRRVNIGDLVMRIGRPMLIVPPDVEALDVTNVVVGWKESRETRRAIVDALPLLQQAGRVLVVEIAAQEDLSDARERLKDVVDWLGRHGVTAEFLAAPSTGSDATRLDAITQEHGAGLIVAGAYGHNRLREWVLGGVTRDLLLRPGRCSLISH
jgi:nucleotide-binding universal stress UspA family protein